MIFEFNTITAYSIIGEIINESKQCRRSIHQKGVRNYIHYKLYDFYGDLVSEYSSSVKGWVKLIARDIYRTQSGSIESICYPHPYKQRFKFWTY